MNGPAIQSFYSSYLPNDLPSFPSRFSVVTLNPDSSGARGSIQILQMNIPRRMAKINVFDNSTAWILHTENVMRFGLTNDLRGVSTDTILVIDGQYPIYQFRFHKFTLQDPLLLSIFQGATSAKIL
jgi:hypothetical protein